MTALLGRIAAFAGVIVVGAALITIFGARQFGGFDQSVLIETTNRVLAGDVPYHDFFTGAPVGFVLFAKLAARALGMEWATFTRLLAAYAAATTALQAWCLVRAGERFERALLLCAATMFLAAVSVGYWWYNTQSSLAASTFVAASYLLVRRPSERTHWVAFSASLALTALSKPNAAAMFIVVGCVWVLAATRAWRRFALAVAAAATACAALLATHGIRPDYVVRSYLAVSGRALPSAARFAKDQPTVMVAAASVAMLLVATPLVVVFLRTYRTSTARGRADLAACASFATASFYVFFTNGEPKWTDLPLLLVPAAVAAWSAGDDRAVRAARALVSVACVLGIVTGGALGATRYRVRCIGAFYEDAPLQVLDHPAFFRGMHASPSFARTLGDVQTVLDVSEGKRLFFGPRMEFAYAAFGVPSPRELPVYWHPGISYDHADDEAIAATFMRLRFDAAVFLRADFTHMPRPLLRALNANYTRFDDGELTVAVRRTSEAVP
jgi:hypothetical protein